MAFGSSKKKVTPVKKAAAKPVSAAILKAVVKVVKAETPLAVLSAYMETRYEGHFPAIRFSGKEGDKRPWSAYTLLGTQLCAATLAELVEAMR